MAELLAVDYTAPNADSLFVESLRETGFGVLKNHPIPESTVNAIYDHWKTFFYSDEKNQYQYNKDKFDGFFPMAEAESAKGRNIRDIKEYYHYYPWGQCPSELKNEIEQYYEQAVEFAATLLAWVEKHTPPDVAATFSQPLSQMIQGSEQSLLRVLHYPPLPDDVEAGAERASAHEDINLLTLLPASNEPGLQVKKRDNTWLDVPCDFGNLIINVGDMLQETSGGHFPSTTHRVINPKGSNVKNSRISLPLFLHPRPDVVLSERHTAGSYLAERLAELRQ
jgi:isopenicillin N synthase-like dioxygenase